MARPEDAGSSPGNSKQRPEDACPWRVVRQVHPQQNRQSCLTTGWMQPIGPNGHQNSPVSCHRQPCGVTEDDIEQFTRFEEGKSFFLRWISGLGTIARRHAALAPRRNVRHYVMLLLAAIHASPTWWNAQLPIQLVGSSEFCLTKPTQYNNEVINKTKG